MPVIFRGCLLVVLRFTGYQTYLHCGLATPVKCSSKLTAPLQSGSVSCCHVTSHAVLIMSLQNEKKRGKASQAAGVAEVRQLREAQEHLTQQLQEAHDKLVAAQRTSQAACQAVVD